MRRRQQVGIAYNKGIQLYGLFPVEVANRMASFCEARTMGHTVRGHLGTDEDEDTGDGGTQVSTVL